jgi:hypothetical protein
MKLKVQVNQEYWAGINQALLSHFYSRVFNSKNAGQRQRDSRVLKLANLDFKPTKVGKIKKIEIVKTLH